MYDASIIDRIKEATDLVRLVERYGTTLKRDGQQLKGLCPFHEEKTPSFLVHPGKQLYHCHGCGASGSALDFVMASEGCGFKDALEMLAGEAGIALGGSRLSQAEAYQSRQIRDESLFFWRVVRTWLTIREQELHELERSLSEWLRQQPEEAEGQPATVLAWHVLCEWMPSQAAGLEEIRSGMAEASSRDRDALYTALRTQEVRQWVQRGIELTRGLTAGIAGAIRQTATEDEQVAAATAPAGTPASESLHG